MEHEQSILEKYEKFTWKVENFSRLKDEVFSEPFVLDGYPWMISLFPEGYEGAEDYLSIYLKVVETANMSEGWSRAVKFKLDIINQFDANKTKTEEIEREFSACEDSFGFDYPLNIFHDPTKGFIVEDICIIGVEIFVSKTTLEKQLHSSTTLTTSPLVGTQTSHLIDDVPVVESTKDNDAELNFSPSIGELVDMSDSRPKKKLCSDHPALVECPLKKDLAFAALVRVLHFLKTRKVKDMNEQAYIDLQVLWEELGKYRFDVSWLEPHVQSALGMRSYVEKVLQAEELKQKYSTMKVESLKVKAKMDAAVINVDVERDLRKAKGLEERDLDSELAFWVCGT